MAKSVTQRIREMSWQDLAGLMSDERRPELERMYRSLRIIYGQRKASFERADIKSYAIRAYEYTPSGKEGYEPVKRIIPPMKKMSNARLYGEVMSLKKFLEAETSTVAGAEEVYRRQDLRLFGADSSGEPAGRLSQDERDFLWDRFEDFRDTSNFGTSSQVQSAILDIMEAPTPGQVADSSDLTEEEKANMKLLPPVGQMNRKQWEEMIKEAITKRNEEMLANELYVSIFSALGQM